MLASKINGLFEDCFQDYCPVKEEEKAFHAQLQMSDVFRLRELTILAGKVPITLKLLFTLCCLMND